MRKITILLIGALVIASAVLIAGCITPNGSQIKEPVLTVTVDKYVSAVYVNDKIQFVLPSNPTTGYSWVITSSEGLTVNETYLQRYNSENEVGAGGVQVYTISADKAGEYTFTAVYKRPWEENVPSYLTFTQKIVVNDGDRGNSEDPVMVVKFDGNINPSAKDVVKIAVAGNPTTGYEWKSTDTNLKILKEDYMVDEHEDGMVGVGGTYAWYVTAEKAGTYTFGAEYKRAWEEEPIDRFFFDLTFI